MRSNQFSWPLLAIGLLVGLAHAGVPRKTFFQQGIDLAQKGREAEALDVFRRITQEDTTCLEAWNNRAALEASLGDLESSRKSLERALAIRSDVSLITKNLERVRSRQAREAYDGAFGTRSNLPPLMLELKRDLPGSDTLLRRERDSLARALAGAQEQIRHMATAKDSLARVAVVPVRVASAVESLPTVPVPAERPAVPVRPSKPVVSTGKSDSVSTPPPAAAPPRSVDLPAAKAGPKRLDPLATARAWAAAWSRKDVEGYLGFYSARFSPPDGAARQAWEARRRERIDAPKSILVEIVAPRVSKLSGGEVEILYKQIYRADDLRLSIRKRLLLTKEGEEWKILTEKEAR